MKTLQLLAMAVVFAVASHAAGHPGRTDANGGHHDRKNGGYHYHSGPRRPAVSTSRTVSPPKAVLSRRTAAPSRTTRSAVKQRQIIEQPEWREWSTADGRFKVIAAALKHDGKTVRLRKQAGGAGEVEIGRLSDKDREYLYAYPRQEAFSKSLYGVVIRVTDGDTLVIRDADSQETTIRIEGIDAPENGQSHGYAAKESLTAKVLGRRVKVAWNRTDRYGRTIGRVYCDSDWIDKAMVDGGHAWHFKQYNNDQELSKAEEVARSRRAGLWIDIAPTPPWEFRDSATKVAG